MMQQVATLNAEIAAAAPSTEGQPLLNLEGKMAYDASSHESVAVEFKQIIQQQQQKQQNGATSKPPLPPQAQQAGAEQQPVSPSPTKASKDTEGVNHAVPVSTTQTATVATKSTDSQAKRSADAENKGSSKGDLASIVTDATLPTEQIAESKTLTSVKQPLDLADKHEQEAAELNAASIQQQVDAGLESASAQESADIDWVALVEAVREPLSPQSAKAQQLNSEADKSAEQETNLDSLIATLQQSEGVEKQPVAAEQQESADADQHSVVEGDADANVHSAEVVDTLLPQSNNDIPQHLASLAEEQGDVSLDKQTLASLDQALQSLLANDTAGSQVTQSDQGEAELIVSEEAVTKPLNKGIEPPRQQQDVTGKTSQAVLTATSQSDSADKPQQVMQLIAKQSEQQRQAIAENLAERIPAIAHAPNPELKGDFVAALQAGIADYKQQLAQGKEPPLDLKALLAEAVEKLPVSRESAKLQGQLDKVVEQVNRLAESAHLQLQATAQLVEPISLDKLQVTESNQAHIEVAKHSQQMQQSDKAVNLSKAEGQQQMAEKVRWMINARSSQAEIRLDPAELGSMQVKVSMSGEAASVSFMVQSPQAREALEQAVPRLREMLAGQGIELGQSSVEQQQSGNKQSQGEGFAANHSHAEVQQDELIIGSEQRITNGALGGIDYYA